MRDSEHFDKSTIALVIGIVGIVSWFIPLIGFPMNITGIVLAVKSSKANPTVAGIALVLCVMSLTATIVNSVIGALMGYQAAQQVDQQYYHR